MNIIIIGAGAVGTYFTARLAKSGHRVCLVDYNQTRVNQLRRRGIKVDGLHRFKVKSSQFVISTYPQVTDTINLIVLAVKAYDITEVITQILPLLKPNVYILPLQNGVEHLSLLNRKIDKERIIVGSTNIGITYLSPGIIRMAGEGITYLGGNPALSERRKKIPISIICQVIDIFNRAGITTKYQPDINAVLWSKLLINVSINPLATILNCNNGMLIKNLFAREIIFRIISETMAIYKKMGTRLIYPNPYRKLVSICKNTADNINSMLQDVRKNKKTEINELTGVIVRLGKQYKIPTPVNQTMLNLILARTGNLKRNINRW